jgi:hypothetical protein
VLLLALRLAAPYVVAPFFSLAAMALTRLSMASNPAFLSAFRPESAGLGIFDLPLLFPPFFLHAAIHAATDLDFFLGLTWVGVIRLRGFETSVGVIRRGIFYSHTISL